MPDTPQQMKAMAVDEFGGPDKLTLHTLPLPTVGPGEVLIRVETAGVGVWDAMERGGMAFNDVHFPRVLGGEGAGTVVTVGTGVDKFKVGDRVYAQSFMSDKGGSYAEYVVAPEKMVAIIPDGLDMPMAGGLPITGPTALSNLNAAKVGSGTKLMLWAASGGVGHVALQLAKRMGADVFAIASGDDGVQLSKELGADDAVDGHSADIAERARQFAPEGFDAAIVLTGGDAVQATLSLVKPGGTIAFPSGIQPEPQAPGGVELIQADGFADRALLDQLNALIGSGKFVVHVAQTFPLEEAAQAQEAMDKHYVGKIVLRVSGE